MESRTINVSYSFFKELEQVLQPNERFVEPYYDALNYVLWTPSKKLIFTLPNENID